MRVLLINTVCGIRSTGRIVTDLAEKFLQAGHECKIAYGRETVPVQYEELSYRIGTKLNARMNALKARIFDNEGFNATRQTKKFLIWATEYDPDILWLHNLHGYYLNIELLFDWIKSRPGMQVKWTLHDCWAFTGHCPHFIVAKCDKWKNQCMDCTQKKVYPKSLLADRSRDNYQNKKQCFTGVTDLTIITPSNWLADLVRQSFLKDYPLEVKHNTINKKIFKPTPSNFRQHYGLQDKKIVLGVASSWGKSKGLEDFIELCSLLDDTYKIVIVGLSLRQRKKLPQEILAIERTNDAQELAKIYSAADIFVNPSKEETFGLTTLEAISCGVEAIVYKGTACEEVINLTGQGVAVECSIQSLLKEIQKYK